MTAVDHDPVDETGFVFGTDTKLVVHCHRRSRRRPESSRIGRTSSPNLVLLDLSKPKMGGLEALPHILMGSPTARLRFCPAKSVTMEIT
jgi:CheY-like chemotaxis protein